jgi:hypothetical protein
MLLSRRVLLTTGSSAALGSLLTVRGAHALSPATASTSTTVGEGFPTQSAELTREVVLVAHGNVARLKELVARQPALARATFDWGFGDWESALGAASHMGNRDIAEFLLAQGARPDIFSAAMLGHLEVVKSWVASRPGIQRTKGPHGITLLAHAKAGGEAARPVLQYLESLGDADPVLAVQPLSEADRADILGKYRFGTGTRDLLTVEFTKDMLSVRRADSMPRPLAHLGNRAFAPAGADAVRLVFASESPASSLTLHDPDPILVARRES